MQHIAFTHYVFFHFLCIVALMSSADVLFFHSIFICSELPLNNGKSAMSSVNGTRNVFDNKRLILPTATPLATGSRPQRQEGQQLTVDFERILKNEENKLLRVTTAYLEACENEWSVQEQLQKERDSLNQKHKCLKVDLRRIEGEIDVLAGAKIESFHATSELYQETRPAGNEAILDLIFREVMDGYEEVNKNERENIRARIATVEEQKVVKQTEIRAQGKKYDDVTTCCNAFEELRSRTETHSDEISNAQSTEVKNSCMENARDWLKRVQEMRNDMNLLLKWINEWKS
ncbi:hypothetical protein CRE_17170 [Caenorhabditis remanei]|uniref:Uncharacterized protein n=1 Tax=Caenorhabditis remanei TaxID=31234 RepID=E3MAI1_CAERE|nr:hypothetical protein CRE_17170 [Caenorhabditis remanei]